MAEPRAEARSPAVPRTPEKDTGAYNLSSVDCRGPDRQEPLDDPSIELTTGGWLLRWKGREVLIFDDIMSLEANLKISDALEITPEEAWKLKVQALEKWPHSIDDLRRLFPAIVGEDDNVKLAILALFSLKLRRPEDRVMGLIIESSNSSGKSYFSRQILKPLRDAADDQVLEFTRITGAFLERYFSKKNIDRKILFLQETSNTPYQLHLSLSEGRLKLGYVERRDGEFKPVEVEAEGQPFLWATTVEWHGSPDLIHRCIMINLDESDEQTKRIIDFENKLSSDPIYSYKFERFIEGCRKVFRNLWRETPENLDVVIPFLDALKEKIAIDLNVKLRRDWNKLIALLKASTIIFHKNRPRIKVNGQEFLVATFDDLKMILPLFDSALKQTLTNLSEKERKVIEYLKRIGAELSSRDDEMTANTVADIFKNIGISKSTLYHYVLPSLERKGFISIEETRPKRVYLAREPRLEVSGGLEEAVSEAVRLFLKRYEAMGMLSCYGTATQGRKTEEMAPIPENKPESSFSSDVLQCLGPINWVKPSWGVYHGSSPLGPVGLSIMLRRRLREFGGEAGLLLMAEESMRWPLLDPLKADNLADQGGIIRKLAESYRGLKASKKTLAIG